MNYETGLTVDLPVEVQASRLARAAGSVGICAAYLHNTVVKLMEHGIDDGSLWELQALVAQEISDHAVHRHQWAESRLKEE